MLFMSETCCVTNISTRGYDFPTRPSFHLRQYGREGIMRELKQLLKANKLRQHELETQRKHNEMMKMEAERRRVFEKYLLRYQGASSFLKDFHTIRY